MTKTNKWERHMQEFYFLERAMKKRNIYIRKWIIKWWQISSYYLNVLGEMKNGSRDESEK